MRSFLIIFILLISLRLAANDAPLILCGGVASPILCHEVEMKSELIEVSLYPDSAFVRCRFVFRNSGNERNVLMGFPERWNYFDGGYLQNFITLVEGDTLQTDYVAGEDSWDAWHIWTVPFQAKSEVVVENSYSMKSYVQSRNFFQYILETGRGWKGQISRSEVVVHLHQLAFQQIKQIRPLGYALSDSCLRWVFTDYEPDSSHNIELCYTDLSYWVYGIKETIMIEKGINIYNKSYVRDELDSAFWSFNTGDYENACSLLKTVIQREQELADTSQVWDCLNFHLGEALLHMGDYRQAAMILRKCPLKGPYGNAAILLAQCYEGMRKPEQAIRYYTLAKIPFRREKYADFLNREAMFYSPETIEFLVIPFLREEGLNAYCDYRIGALGGR